MNLFIRRFSKLASLFKFERLYKEQTKAIENLKDVPVTLTNGKQVIIVAPDNVSINRLYVKDPDDEYGKSYLIEIDDIENPFMDEIDNSFLYDDID